MITQTATGYLVRRIVKPAGPGAWWTFVMTTATLDHAKAQARTMAADGRVRALLCLSQNHYELV